MFVCFRGDMFRVSNKIGYGYFLNVCWVSCLKCWFLILLKSINKGVEGRLKLLFINGVENGILFICCVLVRCKLLIVLIVGKIECCWVCVNNE